MTGYSAGSLNVYWIIVFKFKIEMLIEHQHLALTEVGRDLNYLMFSYIGRKFIIVFMNKLIKLEISNQVISNHFFVIALSKTERK